MKVKHFLVVALVFVILGGLVPAFAADTGKQPVLIIGDSRCMGMANSKYYWACRVGASYSLLNSNLMLGACDRNDLGTSDVVSGVQKYGIKKIVYCLGVNDPYRSAEAIASIKKLKERTGCEVYFLASMPGVSEKASRYGMTINNTQIKRYNAEVKQGIKGVAKYLNGYKVINKIKGWENHTSDGVHYDNYLYGKILEFLDKKFD